VRLTYSPDADALAVQLGKGRGRVGTRQLVPGVYVDLDARGHLVGIEVLNASRHYPRRELEQLPTPVAYLTVAEAAREERLSPATIRRAIARGDLACVQSGRTKRVARHDLWNWCEARYAAARR
jgi:excisionase family DNA binding protein